MQHEGAIPSGSTMYTITRLTRIIDSEGLQAALERVHKDLVPDEVLRKDWIRAQESMHRIWRRIRELHDRDRI